jgi:hypothetical protein
MAIPVIECITDDDARNRAASMSIEDPHPVYFFKSDTSGEKLYEEFYTEIDEVDLIKYVGMGVIKNAVQNHPKLK